MRIFLCLHFLFVSVSAFSLEKEAEGLSSTEASESISNELTSAEPEPDETTDESESNEKNSSESAETTSHGFVDGSSDGSTSDELTSDEAARRNMSIEEIDEAMRVADEKRHYNASTSEEESGVFSDVSEYLEEEEYLIEQEKRRRQLEITEKFSQRVKKFHTNLSENIVSIADSIDSFFINRSVTEGRNRTNIRLTNTTNSIEGSGVKNDFDFKLRLRLPHLKRKIQIEFEDDALVNDTTGARDNLTQADTTRTASQQGGSRGGLSFYQKLLGIETKLTSGLEIRDEVIVFGRFRVTKDFVLTPKQKITFIHDVFDDTTDNKGQIGILNYDYTFNKTFLLRFANEGTYRDINNTLKTTHGFSLYQQISERNFLSYNYRAESINPEAQTTFYLNAHVVNVSFRRRLYREHLYYETGPGLIFPKLNNFEGLWAFVFKLEIIFGNV